MPQLLELRGREPTGIFCPGGTVDTVGGIQVWFGASTLGRWDERGDWKGLWGHGVGGAFFQGQVLSPEQTRGSKVTVEMLSMV